jgi:integrase
MYQIEGSTMTALLRQDRDSKKAFVLRLKDSYSQDARDFVAFLDERGLELTLGGLKAYLDDMRARGVSAQTFNKRLAGAKKRIRQLFDRSPEGLDLGKRVRFEEVLNEIKGQKIASNRIDRDSVPTKGEVKALIKGIRGSKLSLIVEFLATTGLRISELIGIHLEDVKAADSHYLVRVLGKGQKQRAVKVSQDLIERVRKTYQGREYLFETSGGNPLGRESVSREITRAGRRILGKHISAHSLRHAFATAAIKAGWSAKKVAAQLGHSSTAITLDMYVQDAPSWQDVAELWGDLPSRNAEGPSTTRIGDS